MSSNTALAVPAAASPLPVASVNDMERMGVLLAQSNLFGKRNPAEGFAIVGMCQQQRMSWMQFMQTFHLINGVVSKRTDAMLADLRRSGGRHKCVTRTPERAEAVFTNCDGDTYTSVVTWEDCLKEPFVYIGKESDVIAMLARGQTPPLKPKYSTPRARMQMMWARCVSDGVRVVAPECVQGCYTPEETEDFTAAPAAGYQPAAAPMPQAVPAAEPAPEVCPCGQLKGVRWDTMETHVLQQALNATGPFITTAMKDCIRAVLAKRETATVEAEATEPAAPQEEEAAHE